MFLPSRAVPAKRPMPVRPSAFSASAPHLLYTHTAARSCSAQPCCGSSTASGTACCCWCSLIWYAFLTAAPQCSRSMRRLQRPRRPRQTWTRSGRNRLSARQHVQREPPHPPPLPLPQLPAACMVASTSVCVGCHACHSSHSLRRSVAIAHRRIRHRAVRIWQHHMHCETRQCAVRPAV